MSTIASPVVPDTTIPNARAMAARARGAGNDELREQAKEFEAVFMSKMLKSMFSGVKTDGPFGGGSAEESWRGFLLDEYGKSITASGGIGIADAVYSELVALQEVRS